MKLLIAVLAVLAYIGSSHGLVPSNNAVDLIKKEETSDGKPLINAKLDKAANPPKWTIGWGNTFWENGTPVKSGDTITLARAEALIKLWVDKKGFELQQVLGKTSVNQNQFDALTSFAYNMRNWKPGQENGTLMKMVIANPNNPAIRDQLMKYTNGGLAGLVRRRKGEADLYFKK